MIENFDLKLFCKLVQWVTGFIVSSMEKPKKAKSMLVTKVS